jgi:hypothetical protein
VVQNVSGNEFTSTCLLGGTEEKYRNFSHSWMRDRFILATHNFDIFGSGYVERLSRLGPGLFCFPRNLKLAALRDAFYSCWETPKSLVSCIKRRYASKWTRRRN